jgi:hypothetical protein
MKFKAPTLTAGKRATFERTAKWLLNLASDLETKKAHVDKLTLALEEAESRKAQAEKDAALNSDSALAIAGAEAQLSRLAPQVKQQQQSLEKQTATAIHQVNLVRSTEVRELLFGPLLDELTASVATAIGPFFPPDWARQHARNIIQLNCLQYRDLIFYLNRPPIKAVEFEDAKREITAFVGELNQILSGETLLEA